jgi:hypothetical protein
MSRRLPAWVALVALFFAQLVLAAYACPVDPVGPPTAAMGDCAGHKSPVPVDAACEYRCLTAASMPAPAPRDIPVLAAAALVVVAPTLPASRPLARESARRDTMATAPPVAIRFGRFLS